ncbi:MAG TPA: winged helix-turn-helix domain-containing protein [Solirubrobacterales bacterium]|nr:winged helix-turn-helix domain-containing protein [Solirubrobacterales bacterium]
MTQDGNANVDQRLLKALAHPLRAKALPLFAKGAVSPIQVAKRLDVDVSHLAYHIRVLRQLGFIELVETRQRRGALEHFYRATSPDSDEY